MAIDPSTSATAVKVVVSFLKRTSLVLLNAAVEEECYGAMTTTPYGT
jgi:hypothetical protein